MEYNIEAMIRTADELEALSPDRLEAFLVFAEHLSFTHAARVLHVSQPALHGQIGRIADDLGATLYRRVGRELRLTPEGVELSRYARVTLERARAFVDELRGGESSRSVVLAAGEGVLLYVLGPAIRRFLRGNAAPLRLLTRDRDGTVHALRSGEAHLGVAALDAVPDGIVADPLLEVPQVLAVPSKHPLACRRRVSLADLEGTSLVLPPVGRPQRARIEQALRIEGVQWSLAVEATGWPLTLHAVRLGLGLAIVNEFCQMPPGVVAVPLGGLGPVEFQLLRARGEEPTGAVRSLAESLCA